MKWPRMHHTSLFIASFLAILGLTLWIVGYIQGWRDVANSKDYIADLGMLIPIIIIFLGFSIIAYFITRAFDCKDMNLKMIEKKENKEE
ncbi:MAG: hypothetical protein HGB12_00265 [Bacteroidetes bacterium]|nr:hypothetical protein [Bacteroidota bacterium]